MDGTRRGVSVGDGTAVSGVRGGDGDANGEYIAVWVHGTRAERCRGDVFRRCRGNGGVVRVGDASRDARRAESSAQGGAVRGGNDAGGDARGHVRVSEVHVERASDVRGVVGVERAVRDDFRVGGGFKVCGETREARRASGDERRRPAAVDVHHRVRHHAQILFHQLHRFFSRGDSERE